MMNHVSWKTIIMTAVVGLSIVALPTAGRASAVTHDGMVYADSRGQGVLNTDPGSLDSIHNHGRSGNDLYAQATDVQREDRRIDRREDRRVDRQADRRDNPRSNAGGELRGLDRADQVAGEHGREGRDNARAMQMDRLNRPEKIDRPEKLDRPERPDRSERPDKPERSGRN